MFKGNIYKQIKFHSKNKTKSYISCVEWDKKFVLTKFNQFKFNLDERKFYFLYLKNVLSLLQSDMHH